MFFVRLERLLLIFAMASCANQSMFAQNFDPNGLATIDFPVTGVHLGDGVNLISGLSTENPCVEGAAANLVGQTGRTPQTVSVSIRNNKDASTFLQELDVSASAQASFLAGSVSIKTSYVTKHQFDSTIDTISVIERVEQHQYIAPQANAAAPTETVGQRVNPGAFNGLRLNEQARRLLMGRRLDQFQQLCGSGYAAVIIEGGELTATLTVLDHKATDSNTLDVSGGVKVFGQGVDTTVRSVVDQSSTGHDVTYDFLSNGPSGGVVPIDKDTLLSKVKDFANEVAAPQGGAAPFQVVVRSYNSLPNFPADVPPFSVPKPLDEIMTLYWRLDATLTQAIQSSKPVPPAEFGFPFPFTGQSYLLGFNSALPAQIGSTIDQLTSKRTQLASQAVDCVQHQNNCGAPVVSQLDVYSLAAQLPLPIAANTTGVLAYQQVVKTLGAAITNYGVAKSRAVADALSAFGKGPGPAPNCAAQNGRVRGELASSHSQLNAAFDAAEQSIENAIPSILRDDAVEFYVRRPARTRCLLSPFDQACRLTESDFAQISAGIAVRAGIRIKRGFDPDHVDDFGPCPFGNFAAGVVPFPSFTFELRQ